MGSNMEQHSQKTNLRQRVHFRERERRQAGNNLRVKPQSIAPVSKIEMLPRTAIKMPRRQMREHPNSQVLEIAESIKKFGFLVPIVVDQQNVLRAGMGRWLASGHLGLSTVPVVRARALSDAKMRAFTLLDNKLSEKSRWNREALAVELPELQDLLIAEDLDFSITGFSAVEIDQIVLDFEDDAPDSSDDVAPELLTETITSRKGDLFRLGNHKVLCGDAADVSAIRRLVGNDKIAMAFLDPPYNLQISKVVGRGQIKHSEFAMASGELSPEKYIGFLKQCLSTAVAISRDGALHFVCSDWRHLRELYEATQELYGGMLNLAVWVKTNGGQGSFYRSQHELIGIFKVGQGKHLNNVELGRHGRSRTNVWSYPGANSFRVGRLDELRMHPTVKPVAMVVDAIKDCTSRRDLVLDSFLGSGTTLLAAERVGRRCIGVEIEPRFVDLTIRRWQQLTGKDAIHAESGLRFEVIVNERAPNHDGR